MKILNRIDEISLKMMTPFIKSQQKRESLLQFLNFAFIGVVNTIIDLSIYTLLTRYTAFFDYHTSRKYIANVLSFLVATTFSFFCNRTWTFKQTEAPTLGEAAKFYSTTSTGLVLNSLLLFLFIKLFGIYDLVAKIMSTFIVIFWNFLLKRFWVFTPATDTPNVAVK